MSEEVVTKFAQKLASNETKIRARALKKLRKWLSHKSELPNGLTEAELLKLWKGLHYCMWMSDKPVVQEELADSLSNLVHVFPDLRSSLQFVSAYFNTQIREWNGIDRLRLDKYMMLMRKYLHQSFVLVRQRKWKKENVKQLVQMLTEVGAMGSKVDGVPDGLRFHVADIYLEELAKVGAKQLDSKKALLFLDTYCTMLTVEKNKLMVKYVIKHVFEVIISQAVDRLTREQEESSQDSDGEEDMEVDTQKQQQPSTDSIKFDCESLGEKLFKLASSDDCLGRNRKLVYNLVKKFKSLAEGIIPVDQSTLPVVDSESDLSDTDVQGAVHRLVAMEDRIVLGERKRKELVKKRKKNKNSEAADTQEEPSAKKAKVEVETEKKKKGKNKFKDSEDEKQKAKDKSIDKKSANKKIKESTEVEEVDDDELDSDDVVFDDDTDDEFSDEESDDVVHIGGEDQDSDGSESLEDDSESEAESETETKVPAKTVKTTVTKLSMGNKKKKSNKSGNKLGDSTPLFEGGFMDSESSDEESNVTSPSISSPSKNNSIAKGGKKDKNDKLTPKSKKEKSASSKVEFTPLFTGGFMDSDEEIEAPAPNSHNKGSSKKNKTKFETKGSAKKSKAKSENSDEEVEPVTPKSDGLTKDSHSSSEKKQKKKNKLNNSELNSSLPNDKGSSKKDKTKSETKGSVKKSKPKSGNIEDIAIEKQLTSDKSTVVSVLSDSQGKKKKKQSQSNGDIIGDNTEMNVNNNMNTISSKKGKKKSAASKLNLTINAMPEMNTSISKSAEKGQKKRRKSESDLAENGDVDEDGDVEIYVPNKKYKGKLKEWAEEQAKLSIGSGKKKKGASSRDDDVEMNVANGSGEGKENEGKKKKVKGKQEFMKFEKLSKTPPAFVKKSVLKATPKTEPKKSSKKEVDTDLPNSAGKRRVSFGLHKNMAQSTSENSSSENELSESDHGLQDNPNGNQADEDLRSQNRLETNLKVKDKGQSKPPPSRSSVSKSSLIHEDGHIDIVLLQQSTSSIDSSSDNDKRRNTRRKSGLSITKIGNSVLSNTRRDLSNDSVSSVDSWSELEAIIAKNSTWPEVSKRKSLPTGLPAERSENIVMCKSKPDLDHNVSSPDTGEKEVPFKKTPQLSNDTSRRNLKQSVIDVKIGDKSISPKRKLSVKKVCESNSGENRTSIECSSKQSTIDNEINRVNHSPREKILKSNTVVTDSVNVAGHKPTSPISKSPKTFSVIKVAKCKDKEKSGKPNRGSPCANNAKDAEDEMQVKTDETNDINERGDINVTDDIDDTPDKSMQYKLSGTSHKRSDHASSDKRGDRTSKSKADNKTELKVCKVEKVGKKHNLIKVKDDFLTMSDQSDSDTDNKDEISIGKKISIKSKRTEKGCSSNVVKQTVGEGVETSGPTTAHCEKSSEKTVKPFNKEKSIAELEDFLQKLKAGKQDAKQNDTAMIKDVSSKKTASSKSMSNQDRLQTAIKKADDVMTSSLNINIKPTRKSDGMTSVSKSKNDGLTSVSKTNTKAGENEHSLSKKLSVSISQPTTKNTTDQISISDRMQKLTSSFYSKVNNVITPRLTRRRKMLQHLEEDGDIEIIEVYKGPVNQTKYVRTHELTQDEYDIVKLGDWLNDIHINLVHALLKEQFPACAGLENCCLGNQKQQTYSELKEGEKFVQMYNYCANHWITITNYNCKENEVHIYDSFYRSFKRDLKKIVINLYGKTGTLKVIWPQFQEQANTSDCGLFAIAAACSILHGDDPSVLAYKQNCMRDHLYQCFRDKHMSPFPSVKVKSEAKQLIRKVATFDLSKRF